LCLCPVSSLASLAQADFADMGVGEHVQLLQSSIDAAFQAAAIAEEQQLATLGVDDLKAQLGTLNDEVREWYLDCQGRGW
jgi:hypothetical protein